MRLAAEHSIAIYKTTYLNLYETLREAFYQKEGLNPKSSYRMGPKSPTLWELRFQGADQARIYDVMPGFSYAPKYFRTRLNDLKGRDKIDIDAQAVYLALSYLGYHLPNNFNETKGRWNDRATELLNQFIDRNGHVATTKKENIEESIIDPTHTQSVSSCIRKYHEFISTRKPIEAWKLLSKRMQVIGWNKDTVEYTRWTRYQGIATDMQIFNFRIIDEVNIECIVYYNDCLFRYCTVEHTSLGLSTFQYSDLIPVRLISMQSMVEKITGNKVGDMRISRIFDSMGPNYLLYQSGVSDFEPFSEHKRVEDTARLLKYVCVLEDGQWSIDSVRSISTHPLEFERTDWP